MTSHPGTERFYIDANVFIYAAESHPTFGAAAREILSKLGQGRRLGVTSELTLAELLVVPLRQANLAAIATYEGMLGRSLELRMVPISLAILREAAAIRAKTGQKLADAIHLATAMDANCTIVVSQDQALRLPTGLQQMLLIAPSTLI